MSDAQPRTGPARRHGALVAVVLACLGLLIVLAATILLAAHGFWRPALARPGDAPGFLAAVQQRFLADHRGNAAIVLLQDGEVAAELYFSADPRERIHRDSLFQVASLSKWISAWGVLRLADRGLIDLDAPVDNDLKRWSLPQTGFDNGAVTARRLLSHTAGLDDDLGYDGFAQTAEVQPLPASLEHAADAMPGASGVVRVAWPPGSRWQYSGGGYSLLQLMIEDVTGRDFAGYMRDEVLRPLDMRNSGYDLLALADPDLAQHFDLDGKPAAPRKFSALAAASLYTSPADLVRFLQAHLPGPGGAPAGRGVLSAQSVQMLARPHAREFGIPIWGLGVTIFGSDGAGGHVIGHDGVNLPAINTTARLAPASGDAIIALTTGDLSLASRIGARWNYWQSGRTDINTLSQHLPRQLLGAGIAWLALVAAAVALGRMRLRRRHDADH